MANSSGSATGNPRNKIALQPGHSLMDWIRLGNSGVDLSGTGGVPQRVTREQLANHKSKDNAWICLRGNVYNITRYLDFHPGGVEELLRGAGIDATTLFNQVHSWVNFESILQKCLVGPLVSGVDEDVFAIPGGSKKSKKNSNPPKTKSPSEDVIKFDWTQQQKFVTFYIYLKEPVKQLYVKNIPSNELWSLVNGTWVRWSLPSTLNWPPIIVLPTNDMKKIEIKLDKSDDNNGSSMWQKIPHLIPVSNKEYPCGFSQLSVKNITQVNHNVYTVTLEYVEKVFYYVPIGHHIILNATIKGQVVERQYTPITNLVSQSSFPAGITLMVKSYPDGIFSSWLTSRKGNEIVNVSEPTGGFSVTFIAECTHLILIAAGTGFTPMVRIINWALQPQKKITVKLLFFNKTEKDIIWKRELSHLMSKNTRFSAEHILSEAETSWKGKRGWVTLQLLQTVLPDFTNAVPLPYYVCICGPISFTQLTERYLQDMNYTTDNYFCFRG
ncbi:cytochrome b5 reductase 4 isoform X2 [Rhodnius prolixus]